MFTVRKNKLLCLVLMLFASVSFAVDNSQNKDSESLEKYFDELKAENTELRERIERLENTAQKDITLDPSADMLVDKSEEKRSITETLLAHREYSYKLLDPTTNIDRKQEFILDSLQSGDLEFNSLVLSAAITPIMDYQRSNAESKFGYLMRHPKASNQSTNTVSEAVIHSVQLAVTGNVNGWISAYIELLYNPEQSFGAGTTTDLNRNQVQVRRGYLLFGDIEKAPVYFSLGKMKIPFGLTDTVNPFTASTVWHAFGGLAYGANTGVKTGGFNARAMAIQGGAQFRAANVPVDDSNIPSKLNNYAFDMSYTFGHGGDVQFLMGASYIKGSAYCQEFPVTHFSACNEENGAVDGYLKFSSSHWTVIAEYAETDNVWSGTFNPNIPEFEAAKVTSWDIGAKYRVNFENAAIDFSADFSRFEAGPDGAPWSNQDQAVLGVAGFVTSNVKLFGEFIRTDGYAPLNFISGGNLAPNETHSNNSANSKIIMLGANVAF